MNFRIAGTFTDSLSKLTGEDQKAAKTTAFDLQTNPKNPGLSFHKLDRARDKNFWSVRASRDIRIIVHKTDDSLLLCYVDHHDAAYNWAERRKLTTHPRTGAAQIVEIRETVQEVVVPIYVEEERPAPSKPLIFSDYSDEDLLEFGVPEDWLEEVRRVNEDSLLELADNLPEEAAEALLELATGGVPAVPVTASEDDDPFDHPDALRRFRVMTDLEELEQALEYPWEKWTIFLHPAQREMVEREYNGPARACGSAGTGKTIVALHRAVYLLKKNPDARVLLTTFSDALAQALRIKLRRLISNKPQLGERIDVESMRDVGLRLYNSNVGKASIASSETIEEMLQQAASKSSENTFSLRFLITEWEQVVDAWQINSWEGYRDVKRLGRKTRLPENRRAELWKIFEEVRSQLSAQGWETESSIFTKLSDAVSASRHPIYEFAVIDEAQDVSVSQLRFLASLAGSRPEALFFSGDLGQRIFQQPFSWKSLGVDIRGRSKTLRINYRTSHQIRMQADKLLDPEISDVDGNSENRRDTISVFNGPSPTIHTFGSEAEESEAVQTWLQKCSEDGIMPNEMGVFVRSENELERAKSAIGNVGLEAIIVTEKVESRPGMVTLGTMHLAKGLEFRAVAVMACDEEVIPNQDRISQIGDPADLEDVYNTERQLLYVACTRARDRLIVTSTEPASEFLDDLF